MRTFRHLSKLNNGSREMGEVRGRVKLTNALDEELARRQQLAPEQVRVHEADALVDTGAARTVIPARVASCSAWGFVDSKWLYMPTGAERPLI
jgi:hypothetical protein